MNLIDLIKSPQDLMALRDHIGAVLKAQLDLPLKSRKLNELTAKIVGAADFNTAEAMSKRPKVSTDIDPFVVVDLTGGVPHIYSDRPIKGVVVSADADEVENAVSNESAVSDINGTPLACWHVESFASSDHVRVAQHFKAAPSHAEMSTPGSERVCIRASIKSDDGLAEAEFNAVAYFDNLHTDAVDATIANLKACGFSGDYPADEVAIMVSGQPGYQDVKAVFAYIDARNQAHAVAGQSPDEGFYVEINEEDVMSWAKGRSAD